MCVENMRVRRVHTGGKAPAHSYRAALYSPVLFGVPNRIAEPYVESIQFHWHFSFRAILRTAILSIARSLGRSVDAQAAIRELIAEIESSEKIRIVIAGISGTSLLCHAVRSDIQSPIKTCYICYNARV